MRMATGLHDFPLGRDALCVRAAAAHPRAAPADDVPAHQGLSAHERAAGRARHLDAAVPRPDAPRRDAPGRVARPPQPGPRCRRELEKAQLARCGRGDAHAPDARQGGADQGLSCAAWAACGCSSGWFPPVSLYLSHRTPLFSFVSPLPFFSARYFPSSHCIHFNSFLVRSTQLPVLSQASAVRAPRTFRPRFSLLPHARRPQDGPEAPLPASRRVLVARRTAPTLDRLVPLGRLSPSRACVTTRCIRHLAARGDAGGGVAAAAR